MFQGASLQTGLQPRGGAILEGVDQGLQPFSRFTSGHRFSA
jgi:hypothetical protein